MEENLLEQARITVKYFPELYLFLLDELKKNVIKDFESVSEDTVCKYLGTKLLTEFVIITAKQKKYTNAVDLFRNSKVDNIKNNKPFYSLKDGDFDISNADMRTICKEMDDISTTFGLTILEESLLDNHNLLERSMTHLRSTLKNFLKTYDTKDRDMSSYEFVEIIFAKAVHNFIESVLYSDTIQANIK